MKKVEAFENEVYFVDYLLLFILLLPLFVTFAYYIFYFIDLFYQKKTKKPLVVYNNVLFKKLSLKDKEVLQNNSVFYNRLKPKYKKHFVHRVVKFIEKTNFTERNIAITQEMKIIIASVYVQLTFGMRNYKNPLIQQIIIYPTAYLSTHTHQYFKGEFNPSMRTIVFSWEDFQEGLLVSNDNLNLGLHEFTHALHFLSLKSNKPSSVIFKESLSELYQLLKEEAFRKKIVSSGFFRTYAFENQYEFVAVLLEYFFESPNEFKVAFPSIYQKVKEMLNFNERIFIN